MVGGTYKLSCRRVQVQNTPGRRLIPDRDMDAGLLAVHPRSMTMSP
jgi:hypothetical protein